jgi:hypothetical protein
MGTLHRMNEERIAKKILNMKIKENIQEEDHDQDGNNRLERASGRRRVSVISRHKQKWDHQNKMIIISIITVQAIMHPILCVLFTSVFLSSHGRACYERRGEERRGEERRGEDRWLLQCCAQALVCSTYKRIHTLIMCSSV